MPGLAGDGGDDGGLARISARLRALRAARGLTLDALAARSGVSRAMLSRVERDESSPTVGLLAKLCDGLDVTLVALLEGGADRPSAPLTRRAEQPLWRDPVSGYLRRKVSPAGTGSPVEIAEFEWPVGTAVLLDTFEDAGHDRHLWVLAGTVEVGRGTEILTLHEGDCLRVTTDAPIGFRNVGEGVARCAVVTLRGG